MRPVSVRSTARTVLIDEEQRFGQSLNDECNFTVDGTLLRA